MKILISILGLILVLSIHKVSGQDLREFNTYEDLSSALFKKNDTTYVVNFWATWCAPCVKELPYFEAFNKKYTDQKIKVILVSLDFKKQINTHLIPFVKKNKLTSEVVIMNDKKYDNWLPKVDRTWSGSIPTTVLFLGDKKLFAEREFKDLTDLEDFIFSFNQHK